MYSLRRRLSQRWHRTDNEAAVAESCQNENVEEASLASQATALLPQTESTSRAVEDYSTEELHFIVDYVGSAQISEAKSVTRMMETLKRIKKQQIRSIRVDFIIRDGILLVSSMDSKSLILTAPLYAIALCVQEQLRGFDSTFGLNITRKKTHMCHVFQAGSQLEAASIVRTVALAFKAIGKLTREKVERESRRARRAYSISSSERTRTNSEVSTTSTIGSSSLEHRHPHVKWKHGVESSSGRRSPHGKKYTKSSTSPSILRHPTSTHTSGRHVEFSALSPVPSDGSDSDGKEGSALQAKQPLLNGQISVQADIHGYPSIEASEPPIWVKRAEPIRRTSLSDMENESTKASSLKHEQTMRFNCAEEMQPQFHSEPIVGTEYSPPILSPSIDQKSNFSGNVTVEGKTRKSRKLEHPEVPSKEKIQREHDLMGQHEKEVATENFVVPWTSSLLPNESFQKEAVNSPDRLLSNFVKYRGNQPQDMSFPLSDSEGPEDLDAIRDAIAAVQKGETTVVEKFIDSGISVDSHDSARRSLLYYAVSLGEVEMSQFLLKRGADINWEGPDDKSPLHVAATAGNRAVTQLLLGYGANVRAKDNNFCTPLHMSAGHRGKLEVSFLLVEHGARIFENNIHGVRPVDLEPELKEMQRLLVQSACEAFAAADITKSRSNSGASSINQGSVSSNIRSKAGVQSPATERVSALRRGLFQHRRSSSLCSILGGRGSPETGRGKQFIKRSESIHIARTLSPRLANSRRGNLMRMHSFHKTTQDQLQTADVYADQKNSVEQQHAVKQTDSLLEGESIKKDFPHNKAVTESTGEPKETCISSVNMIDGHIANTEEQNMDSALKLETPVETLELNTTVITMNQFQTDVVSSDSQPRPLKQSSDMTGSSEPLHASPEASLLSPFIPKKHSNEKKRPVLDLIQFGEDPEAVKAKVGSVEMNKDVVGNTVPSEEVQHAEETGEAKGLERQLSNARQPSMESDQSVSCQRSTSECEDSSFISTGSNYMRDIDPLIEALEPVVLLSGNPECHSSLLAYLCLPKASGQLIGLAHMDAGSSLINNHIAVLIGNLFNLEGADSRKRSVEAGLIETVLKLVDSPEPIQSTCLSILQSILDFNNDQEFSTALKTIPLEPLLNLLQISDVDSGAFDLRQTDSPPPYPPAGHERPRYRKRSTCSQSSCDERAREMSPTVHRGSVQRNNSGASDARSDLWPQHGNYMLQKKNSICSMGSSADGDHSFPLYSPGFGHNHLPLMDLHSKTMPRVVATKMLSASSIHPKMQMELGKTRPLSLLLDTLTDSNPEIVIYCVATIANIAMSVDNHMQIDLAGGVDGLKQMLNYGDARVRYHAARGLIYLGYIGVGGVYLFKRVPGDEKLDVLFSESTTGEEHLYVRGATVEKIVEIVTHNPSLLWGGLTLPHWSGRSKKHSWYKSSSSGNKHMPSDDQIVDFLLTTYKSYVHPSIFMRLLLHRFHDPWFGKYFDGDPSTGQMQDYSPLPVLHIHLMRLWTAWLEKCPEEFVSNPVMASELSEVILPLRQAGGPYLPCAEILADLIESLMERAAKKHHRDRFQANHCHHAILYEQCQKAIVSGSMPCSVEDSIHLSALQLYIEDLLPVEVRGKPRLFSSSSREKLSVSRIKLSLHPSMYKVKNMGKRIKAQYEQFVNSGMSERNAKHNYIDYCQALPGYGCHFYKLKECVGTVNPKGVPVRCYLGVSPRRITILDEKTKAVIGTWQSKELKRWRCLADDTRLRLEFIDKTFEFVLENKGVFKEINDALLLCTKVELQILAGQDFSPWSKYAEETEMWGQQALEAVARKPAFYSDKYESDSGMVSRLRAISLASSVPDQYAAKVRRQLSTQAKLSSSAPYQQGALQQKCDRGDVVALKTGAEAVLPTTGAAISSAGSPGNVSVGSHTSEDLLLGSLQSTLDPNKCSWEPGSIPTSDQRRPSRSSEASVDNSSSPTERHALDSSGSFPVGQDLKNLASSDRRLKYIANSNSSSLGSDSPSSGQTTPTYKGPFSSTLRDDDDFESVNRSFGQSSNGQLLICQCPPDAELPGFDRRDFSPYDLLQHPKELARQITLIDHEYFCAVTSADIQRKIAIGTGKKRKVPPEEKLSVEKVADRFNQLSTWVAATIVTEKSVEKRAAMFINFIETAKLCLELRNFNAVMAIIVAALGSAPVRRLHKTKELVPKEVLEQYAKMEILMDTKDNYKRYRQALGSSPTPSVPYFGVYMKDLTFIAEGNPDFFKGGLINLTKRRQIYLVIDEIRRFQKDVYNFQEVSEIRDYLANEKIHTEKELYDISCQFEPGLPRRHSEADKSSTSRPVPQFKSNTVGRMAGKRCMSLSRSSTTLETAMPDSTC